MAHKKVDQMGRFELVAAIAAISSKRTITELNQFSPDTLRDLLVCLRLTSEGS